MSVVVCVHECGGVRVHECGGGVWMSVVVCVYMSVGEVGVHECGLTTGIKKSNARVRKCDPDHCVKPSTANPSCIISLVFTHTPLHAWACVGHAKQLQQLHGSFLGDASQQQRVKLPHTVTAQ